MQMLRSSAITNPDDLIANPAREVLKVKGFVLGSVKFKHNFDESCFPSRPQGVCDAIHSQEFLVHQDRLGGAVVFHCKVSDKPSDFWKLQVHDQHRISALGFAPSVDPTLITSYSDRESEVCIVFGSQYPLILTHIGGSFWTFQGEAYVEDYMRGLPVLELVRYQVQVLLQESTAAADSSTEVTTNLADLRALVDFLDREMEAIEEERKHGEWGRDYGPQQAVVDAAKIDDMELDMWDESRRSIAIDGADIEHRLGDVGLCLDDWLRTFHIM